MESVTYLQPAEKLKEETEYTKSMKRQFPLFGIGCILYSAFYAFCLYKNASGITYPFFAAGTLCCFFFSMKKLGVPFKKDSVFYIIGITMLGLSNCMTASPQILFINKCGIFLLSFILMLHTVYNDKGWNFPNYFFAIFQTIGSCFCCLVSPFDHMISYFDAQKQEENTKRNFFLPTLIGVAIAIPLLCCITLLLAGADAIFKNILHNLAEVFSIWNIVKILFLMTTVFFCSYGVLAALCKKDVKEKTEERKRFDPVIAIVVTGMLCVLYIFFSVIQVLYLFIGNMELPEGYTYASYAREGFFQLLAVSIINFLIVLICLYLFRESDILKGILAMICICTFIMIFSSALRMVLYINTYALTFLRVFVLWSLAVIFFLMAGVTTFIFYKRFPLFLYGLTVITICYLGLSFSHPDYWIARYDLSQEEVYDKEYLVQLSADAAPVIFDPSINADLTSVKDMVQKTDIKDDGSFDADYYYDWHWMRSYYRKLENQTKSIGLRNFNFSLHRAVTYME